MVIAAAEPKSENQIIEEVSRGPKATARQRRSPMNSDEDNEEVRYFLAKPNANGGSPALDRQVANEGEALVEALRLGVTYYAVQEFRVVPDFAGRRPQLRKEAVHSK